VAAYALVSDKQLIADKCLLHRRHVVKMVRLTNSGHIGGSYSLCELAATLYYSFLKHDPANPKWDGRDYVVWSKGHVSPLAYSILADCGYFPKEELATFRKLGTRLQGHPDRLKVPGIEVSTGPLGEGYSMGLGLALATRVDKKSNHVWVFTGDGEHQEGEVWEAVMAAGNFKTDNLTVVLDYNKKQNTCEVNKVMCIEPIADKYRAFNWNVIEVKDGHDIGQIMDAYKKALAFKGKPTVIIAHTVKGKGVALFENEASGYHGMPPNDADFAKAMAELGPAKWPDFF